MSRDDAMALAVVHLYAETLFLQYHLISIVTRPPLFKEFKERKEELKERARR